MSLKIYCHLYKTLVASTSVLLNKFVTSIILDSYTKSPKSVLAMNNNQNIPLNEHRRRIELRGKHLSHPSIYIRLLSLSDQLLYIEEIVFEKKVFIKPIDNFKLRLSKSILFTGISSLRESQELSQHQIDKISFAQKFLVDFIARMF